jgi:hypothetical protein
MVGWSAPDHLTTVTSTAIDHHGVGYRALLDIPTVVVDAR